MLSTILYMPRPVHLSIQYSEYYITNKKDKCMFYLANLKCVHRAPAPSIHLFIGARLRLAVLIFMCILVSIDVLVLKLVVIDVLVLKHVVIDVLVLKLVSIDVSLNL